MKVLSVLAMLFVLVACNNDSNRSSNEGLPDPEKVEPPAEAITDSTAIVHDSTIMPLSEADSIGGDIIKGNP